MTQQVPLDAANEVGTEGEGGVVEIVEDVATKRLMMVNVALIGKHGCASGEWVLVDCGLPGMAGQIKAAATHRFGENCLPGAILLTHGHVDHVGALEALVEHWDVPVYAHPLKHPYLNGRAAFRHPIQRLAGA